MKTILRHAFLAIAAFATATFVWAQSGEAVGVGTWKLNVEKSKFSPGPAPKSLTTKFEPDGKGVKWKVERTAADGQVTVSEFTAQYDGKDYPLKGSTTVDAVSMRRIDPLTTERVNKKDGKVVSTETREVAKDGKSYITTVKGTTAKGEPIHLGPTEYRLLHFFVSHPERVYTREQVLDRVWGRNVYVEERTVDVHIRRLRKALEPFGCDGLIQTVRGTGYRFSEKL